ncbi:MAG: GTPase domain-containing protein [Hormoscilla sp.]
MGVVYIGDRNVGKTHLAVELAKPAGKYVSVSLLNQSYDNLRANLLEDGTARPTADTYTRPLDVQVRLPTGTSQITLDWIDTPGEIFRKSWQSDRTDEWNSFKQLLHKSEGILLIVPPYREILQPSVDPDNHMTQQQWCNRFDRWVEFFQNDCPQARHIVICLNKADLIYCNLDGEASKLAYDPYDSKMNWFGRHNYVMYRYFRPVLDQLAEINGSRSGLSVRCFITSIYNRTLLELPWIYLASYLAI